jgi:hypothetical protein
LNNCSERTVTKSISLLILIYAVDTTQKHEFAL